VLDLVEELRAQVVELAHAFVGVRVRGDGDEPVVLLDGAVPLALLGRDDADEPRGHETAGERRLVHQNEDVERVAVAALRGGDEAEVEWKARAGGEDALEAEEAELLVVCELVPAAGDRLDDGIEVAGLLVERRERSDVELLPACRHPELGSDLLGSDLLGSDLLGTDLMGTDLMGTDLMGTDPMGSDPVGFGPNAR